MQLARPNLNLARAVPFGAGALIVASLVSGCVETKSRQCTADASAADIASATGLIEDYVTKTQSLAAAKGFLATNDRVATTICDRVAVLEYAPKDLHSTEFAMVGARVRYTVDLERQTVLENYLE